MNPDNQTYGTKMVPAASANGADGSVSIPGTDTAPLRHDVAKAVTEAKDHIAQDINTLVTAAGTLGRAELSGAAQRVSAFMSQVSATACEVTKQGKQQAQLATQKTGEYVKENPWQSLAVALALGYAVARLTNRR